MFLRQKRVYLDFAAATPLCKDVLRLVNKKIRTHFANPDSLYKEGREEALALLNARKSVAATLGVLKEEIIFTSGGTESNNLAISGIIKSFLKNNPGKTPHIITSKIEHSSILEVCTDWQSKGVEVTFLSPQENGMIDPKDVEEALKANTVLVSLMYVNNEIGTINPIKDIARVIRKFKNTHHSVFPFFHTDAVQAPNYIPLSLQSLGVDLLSLDGLKIYGLKGTGCLFKKKTISLEPVFFGGGQEAGQRPGTSNTLGAESFAVALSYVQHNAQKESQRLGLLQDFFVDKLLTLPKTTLNGLFGDERIPNNVNVCIQGLDAEYMVYLLDEAGFAVSSASTCMNNKEDSYSYVVKEIQKKGCEKSSLRFTFGMTTTKKDLEKCFEMVKKLLPLALSL